MTATILAFPADRRRQPASAVEAAERAAYEHAAKRYATEPGHSASITTMMRLACEGTCDVARPQAAEWLLAQRNVLVR